jgi:hypothetical protein
MAEKPEYPTFMVFAEQVPEAARLHDPNTPADEKERIRSEVNALVDVVRDIADRNTQKGRNKAALDLRESVMADLRVDARGKPIQGEPSRLHEAHGVPVIKIRKWIAQRRKSPRMGAEAVPDDWRTVVYGQMLRRQRSEAAKKRKG